MATRSLGQLTLDLVARTGGFVQGMDKAQRRSAKWRRQVSRDLEKVRNAFKLAGVAAATAFGAMAVQTINNARELERYAQMGDTTTQTFQRMSYGANRFGVDQEKLADILKDVNDRIGDYVQTGGGPMADFFENIAPKVGVTADQFARLSGPEALQLYVSSLEAAGVSQKDMTFYMEAIASDTTALIPLLANGGAEMQRLGNEAERTGNVFSEMEFDRLRAAKTGIDELTGAAIGMKNEMVLGALPAVNSLVDQLSDPQTLENAKALGEAIATAMGWAVTAIDKVVEGMSWVGEEIAAWVNGPGLHDIERMTEAVEDQQAKIDRLTHGPMQAPQSVIDREIEKLKDLEARLQRGIDLQNQLTGMGRGGGAGGDAGAGDGSGGASDATPSTLMLTNEQAGRPYSTAGETDASRAVADFTDKAEEGTTGLRDFNTELSRSSQRLASAYGGAADWGRGAMGAMEGEQDNGGRSVRQRIEAGKDTSPYWLEPNPTAHGTYTRPASGMEAIGSAQRIGGGGGGTGTGTGSADRVPIQLSVVGANGETTTGEAEVESALVDVLEAAAAGTRR
ncbi:hypothetical protein [Halomonas getboli]|uniref:hypothetical protein n=1 Tax=Halomonas getboli TaxID=2935862 RepID=UPI001FFFEA37|nr:hypothetical protein [Halomonas getboli]MCK2183501.1 hypothetical protein [Halomonas getboli]